MIEKTIFETDDEIKEYVKKTYGIVVNNVERLNRGSANIYSLNNNQYILKEFQSKYTKDEIDKEVVIINHLSGYNIKVPKYIKTLDNKYSDTYKSRTLIIQEFIPGYTLKNNEGTYEQTLECAEYYGKIVDSLKSLPIKLRESDISIWYSKDSFEKGINKINDLLKSIDSTDKYGKIIKKDLNDKLNMINQIRKLDFKDFSKMTIMNTHGDYSVRQFIYMNGKINAVIDFVSASKMPIAWELIRSYSYIDSDAKDGEFNLDTFIQYIKVFDKYVKLNKYDIENMVFIYLVQLLTSTYGYKEYLNNKNYELLKFGFFRTKLCRYLYNNHKIITNKLKGSL